MGVVFGTSQVNPNSLEAVFPCKSSTLLNWKGEVSRANFKFISKLGTSGLDQQSIFWLATNISNSEQKFYIKQINKYKVYNHKRIDSVMNQLKLLTQSNNQFIIKVFYAFQDYQYLYLVSEALESLTLQQILKKHVFTQDQTRYVVMALISVIEYVHNEGFTFSELQPKNIHIQLNTGHLKLVEIPNPALIDTFCSSSIVSIVCPYSAPQILYRDRVLAECDFYSLGLIMYQMMTQTKAISLPEGQQFYKRNQILKENIEVEKSQIPQDWAPEAADFLIKLLIKNPALRLGRFGSFEVKNHAWLKQFDMEYRSAKGIQLKQNSLKVKNSFFTQKFEQKRKATLDEFITNFFFQQLFQRYKFQLKQKAYQIFQAEELDESLLQKTSIIQNSSHIKLRST